GAVAGVDLDIADADLAAGGHEVEVTVGGRLVCHTIAGLDRCAEHARLGAERESGVAPDARGKRDEPAATGCLRERPRAPRRFAAATVGDDPDLEDQRGLVFEVVFGVLDAGSGGHYRHVARFGAAGIAETVL